MQINFPEIIAKHSNELQTHKSNLERVLTKMKLNGASPAAITAKATEMYDSFVEKMDGKYRPAPYACKPGCAHCCAISVETTQPEVFRIAEHIRQTRTTADIDELRARILIVLEERGKGNRPRCALLGSDDCCTIYTVRPISCRGCNSADVEPCRKYEENGDENPKTTTFPLPVLIAGMTQIVVGDMTRTNKNNTEKELMAELQTALIRSDEP